MVTVDQVITGNKSQKSLKAKANLKDFVIKVDSELEKYFNSELKSPFGVSLKEQKLSRNIWEHIKEHNLRPAKRLRGSFIYYGYILLHGKDLTSALKAALCIELVHTGLLMHDDFMDEDDIRRGGPTTHEYYKNFHISNKWIKSSQHYGESMAVNLGDIAMVTGFEILSKSKFSDVLKIIALNRLFRGIINTGIGQAYDITLEAQGNAGEEDILSMSEAKTAIYTYQNPLHIGMILAGAKSSDLNLINKYAIPAGIAFQLQDDILGVFGDSAKTGKLDYRDIKQGKMTLLLTKTLEMCTPAEAKTLNALWGKQNISTKEVDFVRKIITNCGSLDYSINKSTRLAQEAQKAIPLMRNLKWEEESIDYLDGIAQYMVERDL